MPAPKKHLLDGVSSPSRSSSSAALAWLGWAAAAGLAIVALWLGQLYFTAHTENSLLRQEQALAHAALRSSQNQLEAERILNQRQLEDAAQRLSQLEQQLQADHNPDRWQTALLTPPPGHPSSSRGVAVWISASHEGVLQVEGLPATSADEVYKLWLTPSSTPAIPARGDGFRVDPRTGNARIRFNFDQPIGPAPQFAISLGPRRDDAKTAGLIVLVSH